MKRVLPPEIQKVKGWLMLKAKWEWYNKFLDLTKYMENGVKLNKEDAEFFKMILLEYKQNTDPKAKSTPMEVAGKYFRNKYGEYNGNFIMSRIRHMGDHAQINSLIDVGEKIALLNSWRGP